MKFSKHSLALAIMAASVSVAHAQAETSSDDHSGKHYQPTLLNQVTVSATRTEKQLKDIAGSVVVVDEEQIEKNMATDIKHLVRYEPGVTVGSDGRSGSEGFNIRGMDGNRVKIMVDGVDQPQQFKATGANALRSQRNFVDVDSLKAVEIVKGPSSSLYGGDAIGGIVAFQTKDPEDYLKLEGDDTAASVKGAYTSADKGLATTFTLANRTGDLESLLIYTHRKYNETKTHSGLDVNGESRGKADPMDFVGGNLLGKLRYQLNDNHRIGLDAEYQKSKSDIALKSGLGGTIPVNTTGNDKKERKRIGVFHEWEASVVAFDRMRWQLDWQDSQTKQITDIPAYTNIIIPKPHRKLDYRYREKSLKLSTQFEKTFATGDISHNLVYGADIRKVKLTSTRKTFLVDENKIDPDAAEFYAPEVDNLSYGLFAQNDMQITKRFKLSPGLRYDSFDYKPKGKTDDGKEAKRSKGDKLTGRLGAIYDLNDNLSVFGQLSQGFKAPGIYEMYYTTPKGWSNKILANPNLKPEESNSIELGFRGDHRVGSFELTGFFNRYKNFIDLRTVEEKFLSTTNQHQNISKAEIKGVEFRGELWLDEAFNAPAGTSLRTSIAYARGKNKENDKALNSVAPLTAVLGLGYDDVSGNWGGELAWTLVKGKSASDIDHSDVKQGSKKQFNPAGYGIVDLTAYYHPMDNLTLRAGLFNITDKKYHQWQNVRGRNTDDKGLDRYTQPGRNFSVSVKWDI
ncbi:TonB-dependent hemoglobin/transferrin/lactoferrin family receptor [Endozoicomonas gorgoniicola]|uniref:TonB-dependent hemoglobin/transferrin/lactoferrin family receptor n=1 Tax=Endozoicomonas gorgoniicola TaxID=1234144 RepID=A0ABT3MVV0_9GAMM|nr:TonB-dependent hemoglobin/transferrin/lactoferrin family receptor [Endozoicomonas gorgoniicola]MCW7553511.1 TonB-dependent hemoglobin/transferrin/lactoferrin family receptor [Endozoicomonas gorgoniicola]